MNNLENLSTRKSGIDLLRIFAILLICIFHAAQTFSIHHGSEPAFASKIVSFELMSFGNIGNVLFIICSSFFLVDKPKASGKKVINILMDASFISILILIVFLICKVPIEPRIILRQIFPNLYKQNWFVPCYVIFYLLSPIIVSGLKAIPKQIHFALCVGSIFVYGVLSIVPSILPVQSNLFAFFYILNFVAYIKWYIPPKSKRKNAIFFLVGMTIFFVLYTGTRVLSRIFPVISDHIDFLSLYNPLLCFPLIALFNLFKDMNFSNRFISYLSTCSLFVYVIHENYLLRSIVRTQYFNYMIEHFGIDLAIVFILLCGITMFLGGFIIAILYKETLHKVTKKLSVVFSKVITLACNKLFQCFCQNPK